MLRGCIYLGEYAPAFGLRKEIEGVGGRNLRYIHDETGVHVSFEGVVRQLAVTAHTDVAFAGATRMAWNLAETVKATYGRWCAGGLCDCCGCSQSQAD